MQLLFKTRDRDAQALRDWAQQRATFVLRRLSWRLSHATVRFTDVDGQRHGIDKRCQVSLVAEDGAPVVVTATARDWRTAFNEALARSASAFRRLFRRALTARRTERRFIRDERRDRVPAEG